MFREFLEFLVAQPRVRDRDRLIPFGCTAGQEEPALAVAPVLDPQVPKGSLAQQDERQQPSVARAPGIGIIHPTHHFQERLVIDEGLARLAGLWRLGLPVGKHA